MSTTFTGGRLRWAILLAVTAVVLAAAGVYAVGAYQRFEQSSTAAPSVGVTAGQPLPDVPFVLFRNTAGGQGYGNAATVALSSPDGTRAVSEQGLRQGLRNRVHGNLPQNEPWPRDRVRSRRPGS
ncbi:hypothetical protein [Arthrobacter sp. StoSoilB13]|uniref:hypothetical protein n=1 Tax=Arthrobacter sp. StoSoilB13 TaxID=2830993 RepID=UPI001CC48116|nr:hypothetical protein [Arthrobacter sp. StoSoilB13]